MLPPPPGKLTSQSTSFYWAGCHRTVNIQQHGPSGALGVFIQCSPPRRFKKRDHPIPLPKVQYGALPL